MNFKSQLEYYLAAHFMNPSQLSRLAQVPRQNVSNWLMNQKPKDVDQVKRVADVFQVSIDHLLFGDAKSTKATQDPELELERFMNGRFEIRIKKICD